MKVYAGIAQRKKRGGRRVWVARIIYTDADGIRREHTREETTKTKAREARDEMKAQYERSGGRELDARRMKFSDLADHYEKHYLKPPVYHEGRKLDGLRSYKWLRKQQAQLREHFHSKLLKDITHADLRGFRAARISQPTRADVARHREALKTDKAAELRSTRAIASVNRELALLRRMLNVAQSEGWIARNPFARGKSLISAADERKRMRILTRDEERQLLDACLATDREHLAALFIAALDTGMRRGELLTLRWSDVDMAEGAIFIRAMNTKTLTARTVYLTKRLEASLRASFEKRRLTLNPELVFGVRDAKRAFEVIRREAGLTDVRFHDLRHTAATQLVRQGIPLAEVARVLGHQDISTTYRYVNADAAMLYRAAQALNDFHQVREEIKEVIN